MYLLLAFIGIPILEITVFIMVGDRIGMLPTIALVMLTAVTGIAMLRYQGLATLQRVRASLERNEMPLKEVFDGLCLLIAGVLLLTPGFVTDAIGLLLFMPPVRAALRHTMLGYLRRRGEVHLYVDGVEVDPNRPPGPTPGLSPAGSFDDHVPLKVIDADFKEVDGKEAGGAPGETPPDSRWGAPDSRFRR